MGRLKMKNPINTWVHFIMRSIVFKIAVLLLVVVFVSGCLEGFVSIEDQTDEQKISSILNQYEQAMNTKNSEKLAELLNYPIYLGDGKYIIGRKEQAVNLYNLGFSFITELHEFKITDRAIIITSGDEAVVEMTVKSKIETLGQIVDKEVSGTLHFRQANRRWSISGFGATLGILQVFVNYIKSVPKWSININSYSLTDKLSDDYFWYQPDEGYQWLVFNVSVTNLTQEEQSLNFSFGKGEGFNYIAPNGDIYIMSSILSSFLEYSLLTSFNSGQTKSSKIYFEIPIDIQIEEGMLFFKTLNSGQGMVFDLTRVPKIE